jgi:transcriptional regulator with XRE-family HTH domain
MTQLEEKSAPAERNKTNEGADAPSFGSHVRSLRKQSGFTLSELAKATGLSVSALSKIENNQMSPTFSNLMRLAEGFNIHIADLVSFADNQRPPLARFVVTRSAAQSFTPAAHYSFTALCADLREKRMNPLITRVSPKPDDAEIEMVGHQGEEFIYVLKGPVEIRTRYYKTVRLETGDSLYMDSTMAHCYAAAGKQPAEVLVIWLPGRSQSEDQVNEELAAVTGMRQEIP